MNCVVNELFFKELRANHLCNGLKRHAKFRSLRQHSYYNTNLFLGGRVHILTLL